jgi:hypothetical protein
MSLRCFAGGSIVGGTMINRLQISTYHPVQTPLANEYLILMIASSDRIPSPPRVCDNAKSRRQSTVDNHTYHPLYSTLSRQFAEFITKL